VLYEEIIIRVTADFLADILQANSNWEDIFKIFGKENAVMQEYYTQKIYPAEILSEIQKWREFINIRLTCKICLLCLLSFQMHV
jgi:hypothetical protein